MKRRKLPTCILLVLIVVLNSSCTLLGQVDDNSDEEMAIFLLAAAYVRSLDLSINGSWTDTSDSDAQYTITNNNYIRKEYLGSSSPKSDYSMSVVNYSNGDKILKLSGLQLDFAGFPTIATKSNTIFQRTRFAIKDNNTFYYCSEVFNKASMEELDADTTTYTFTGENDANCSTFTWSKMTRN